MDGRHREAAEVLNPQQAPAGGCRACGTELVADAAFCAACGMATRRGQRQVRVRLDQEARPVRRAALALATLFLGGIVALLAGTAVAEGNDLLRGLFLLGSSVLPLALLGWPSWRQALGGRPGLPGLAMGILAGILGFACAWGYVELLHAIASTQDADGLAPLSPWWATVLMAPLVEEWLLRGVAWEAVWRIGGTKLTILLTATMFAMMHGLNGGFWLEFPHRLVGGILLGLVRWRSASLAPSILAHMTWNGLAVLLLG